MRIKIQNIPAPAPPPPRIWTSLDLIKWTAEFFQKKGIENPRLEAELLLAEALGCERIRLYVDFEKPVAAEKLAQFREFVRRRGEAREPLQYIIGHTQFLDLKLKVTPAVLIPRPETEMLALWAVERLKELSTPEDSQAPIENRKSKIENPRVLDLCTGSGCLALYIAAQEPRAMVVATDSSELALKVASDNASVLKLAERVSFRQGDLFAALRPDERESFDLVVSNPPYIDPATRDTLQPEVRDHEPAEALFADERGLAVLRRIIAEAPAWLRPGGRLGVEFGMGQAEESRGMALAHGFAGVEIREDAAKLPRFVFARRG